LGNSSSGHTLRSSRIIDILLKIAENFHYFTTPAILDINTFDGNLIGSGTAPMHPVFRFASQLRIDIVSEISSFWHDF